MKEILVSEIMTRDPVKISPDATLLECAKEMVKKKVNSLLLVEDKRLLGFIASEDILWALVKAEKKMSKIKASDIAIKKIATIRPDATIKEALEKMKSLRFRRLPVIQQKELIGIVTMRDVLNFQPQFYPELEEIGLIREQAEKLKRVRGASKNSFVREGICEEC